MPIYEYQCVDCEAVTDIKHDFKEPMDRSCPACSGRLKRVFRPAGIVFKGSGFYVTDSRKGGAGSEKSTAKPAEKGSEKAVDGASGKPAEPASKPAAEAPASSAPAAAKSGSGGTGDAAA